MKKIIITSLLLIAVFSAILIIPTLSSGKSYPRESVASAIETGAVKIGGNLMAQGNVSHLLENVGTYGRIKTSYRELTGQKTPDAIVKFMVSSGSGNISILVFERNGVVYKIQSESSKSASKVQAALRDEILKLLPDMKFKQSIGSGCSDM